MDNDNRMESQNLASRKNSSQNQEYDRNAIWMVVAILAVAVLVYGIYAAVMPGDSSTSRYTASNTAPKTVITPEYNQAPANTVPDTGTNP